MKSETSHREFTRSEHEFDVGRYDELRPGMYATELFSDERFHM